MKKYIESYYKWLINWLWFLTIVLLTTVAYWAYVNIANVSSWTHLTADTFNQVLANIDSLKTTVDWHSTTLSWLSNVPSWAVMAFNLSWCPTWWIAANWFWGTPDLRWEFIRWLDNGRNIDTGRTLASTQTDELKSHSHTATSDVQWNHTHTWLDANWWTFWTSYWLVDSNLADSSGFHSLSYAWAHSHNITVNPTWGSETRPHNVALLYCIKQ